MQGEGQRSLSTMLLVAGAFLAMYYGTTFLFGEPPAPRQGGAAEPTPEERARQQAEARRDAPERLARRASATITTDDFVATIDNLGGGLTHFELTAARYREAGRPHDAVTTDREEYRPLRIDLPGVGIPADAVWELEQESPTSVRLRWVGENLEVVRRIEAGSGPYQLWQTVRVRNTGVRARALRLRVSTWHYVRRQDEGSGLFGNRSPAMSQGVCRSDDETIRKTREDLYRRHGYRDPGFVAIENVYFVQALAPDGVRADFCGLWTEDRGNVDGEPEGALFEATLLYPAVELQAGQEQVWRHLAYVGPKVPEALDAAGHGLSELLNLGMFAAIARVFTGLLRFIYDYVGNWGVAIVLLTLLVRILIFPLNDRSFKAMARMRKLKPELDRINELYPNDPEKKQAAILDVYRRHGINPLAQLGGCLPVLLQMPVFFALYASLSTNVELYHQPFVLWWQDLSAPDPYFVLPLALGALMWLQQKLTPTTMDPAQARVMQFMPVIVTAFMLFLPSGLCLYMLTSSVLGIAQQQYRQWQTSREEAAEAVVPPSAVAVDAVGRAGDAAGKGGESKDQGRAADRRAGSARGAGRSRRG